MDTYSSGHVARALRIPVRRLEGWAEQGVLTPQRAQRGRRRYAWDEVLRAGVLVELQALFGPNLRPGSLGKLLGGRLVKWVPSHYFSITSPSIVDQDVTNPIWLVFCLSNGGKPEVQLFAQSNEVAQEKLRDITALVRVNLTTLGIRIREALNG